MKIGITGAALSIIMALLMTGSTTAKEKATEKVTLRIVSAVLDKENLTIAYEIASRSTEYLEMIIPARVRSPRRTWSARLPFRIQDGTGSRMVVFSDVAHCSGSQEPPHGSLSYGIKRLRQGSQTGKIVLPRPVREYFPFHKTGTVHDLATLAASERYIDLDSLKYLRLEDDWLNFVDDSKRTARDKYGESIDLDNIKTVKLTIAILREHGQLLEKGVELEAGNMCGQVFKPQYLDSVFKTHMFYTTDEKEITRTN